jgi:hypothetical protein
MSTPIVSADGGAMPAKGPQFSSSIRAAAYARAKRDCRLIDITMAVVFAMTAATLVGLEIYSAHQIRTGASITCVQRN